MAPATSHAARLEGLTITGRDSAAGPVLHPRICAMVTFVSCGLHLWLAAFGQHGAWVSVLMLALAVVCVPCTVHIWQHSRVGALHRVTLSALAMVALHAVLLLGSGGTGHAHTGVTPPAMTETSGNTQLLLVIALELATGLLAATLIARLRQVRTRPSGCSRRSDTSAEIRANAAAEPSKKP